MKMLPPPMKRIPPRGPGKTSARARVLAQWRGVDVTPLEIAQAVPARRADSVMPKLMVDLRMDKRRGEAEIVRVWNHLLDPAIASHAQPTGIRNGTLFVTVDNSVWLSEIVRYRREEILERLQHSFGTKFIQKISYRVG